MRGIGRGAGRGDKRLLWGVLAVAASAAPAQAAPDQSVLPLRARPGDVVLVTVPSRGGSREAGADAREPRVKVEGRDKAIPTWPTRRGHQALVPIPRDRLPGPTVVAVDPDADSQDKGMIVEVRPREMKVVRLQVDPKFVEPPVEARTQIQADGEAINAAYASSSPTLQVRKPFRWPRPEVDITSRFGEKRIFNGTLESEHEGTDLRAREGDPVRAANEGKVVMSRDCFHSGNTVIIDHGGGLFTAYFHLSQMQVKEGERVAHGQTIGLAGSTGRSTAPHVHFAVHAAGDYVDSESFMRLRQRLQAPAKPVHASR